MTIAVRIASSPAPGFALDIDMTIPIRGVTALTGPSGAGKTSVLRALAGLDRHPGTIRFGETVWQEGNRFVPAHKRQVGLVFQGMGLLPHLSVSGNLDFAAKRAPQGPFDRDAVIALTGIAGLLDRRPSRLSGGEAQRASMARALLSQPQLLLMDEPLSGIDTAARADLIGALDALFAATDIPIVYVTHDLAEAARLASHSVRLEAGRVVA